MFGLFKKTLPAQIRPALEARAREAVAHMAGQIHGTEFVLQGGTINFAIAAERKELQTEVSAALTALSRNRENWTRQLKELFDEYDKPETTVYKKGAFHVLAALIKTDVVCRATDEYPNDKALSDIVTHVLVTTLTAFDYLMTGTKDHTLGEPLPSTEILSEFQYANAHFERRIGFR
ncbi:hypothetical protein [Hyphomicrobium sp.]|uniref:hypothetical protein n=1 Tax=Hyphomicrobium sp. TaxID=82 RepID=UPI002E3728F6|nr:hypothetical protein [Hyphomicrobium sp.]HEX2842169.1 hypothetical protein [Hyphomicrobium sp.]